MQKLLRLLRGERRRTGSREAARRTAHLFHDDAPLGEARILDESEGGFRIAFPGGTDALPDTLTLLEVETALAHEVRVAWRDAETVGLQVVSEQRLRGYVPPRYQALKMFWEKAAVITA